ncbi:hypothetical protein K438DRAFT_1775285 [Mycena galopus ATCC 62051]|nr:hypothetical protein K438DRAFT_1775285 [Mycena galopus ATCC 62051]
MSISTLPVFLPSTLLLPAPWLPAITLVDVPEDREIRGAPPLFNSPYIIFPVSDAAGLDAATQLPFNAPVTRQSTCVADLQPAKATLKPAPSLGPGGRGGAERRTFQGCPEGHVECPIRGYRRN